MTSEPRNYDDADPVAYLHLIELAWLTANPRTPLCWHCEATAVAVPMEPSAYVLDVTHDPKCPIVLEAEG